MTIKKDGTAMLVRMKKLWNQVRLPFWGAIWMMPVFASILFIHKNSRAGYPGFLIYFAAMIAFAKIGTSISNIKTPLICILYK
ncbi:MAG: hypothetical protein ACI3XG_04555 [Faecousia sp.]